MADDTPLFLITYACHFLWFAIASADSALSAFVTCSSLLSTILNHFLSFVTDDGLLSAVSDCFSFLITSNSSLSTVSYHLLSLVISNCFLSIVFNCFLSLVASDGPSSTISSDLLFFVASSDFLSTVSDNSFLFFIPLAGSRALFLPNTLSCMCCFLLLSVLLFYSFLPSSPTLFTHHLTLFTGKKMFNQAFIAQKPIASIQQQKKLDLKFERCLYSTIVQIIRMW